MRYQKVVNKNGVETARYNYVYADGQLILLSYTTGGTTQNAKFIYSSAGEVLGFIVDGVSQYLYVKNLQGDIVAIVNESGVPVVRYIYDAWGNVTISADTGYENLINLSPFAYRGYCYDNDIKMYYLQSRYYDPQICRFINADSSEYLGMSAGLISYNLMVYCENDPVNCIDATGAWGYDVHAGYYQTKNANMSKSQGIKLAKLKINWVKSCYVPVIDNRYYGTFYWAYCVGFSYDDAITIGKACNKVDTIYSPFLPFGDFAYNQTFHFNTNKDKSIIDSRFWASFEMLIRCVEKLELMKSSTKKKDKEEYKAEALEYLGYALHPLQDFYAHTDKYVEFSKKEDFFRLVTKKKLDRNFKINTKATYPIYNGIEGAWHHLNSSNVDKVSYHKNNMWKAAEYSLKLLKLVYDEYFS